MLVDPQIIESASTITGPILAAAIVAAAGFLGYGRQKDADRKYDLMKLRQAEYQTYLLAFQRASKFKGVDDVLHAEAEATYHETQNFMLLHASADVLRAVNSAHSYYVWTRRLDWRTYKGLYAEMIKAMRKDGFSPTEMSVEELADNIPWTIGTELEDRKAPRDTAVE